MKTTLLLSAMIILSVFSYARIRTVSNDTQTPSQYGSINAAIAASSIGDTVYVQGSATAYNEVVSINKRLVLMGTGANPDKPNPVAPTLTNPNDCHYGCTNIQLDTVTSVSGASGSVIEGFLFAQGSGIVANYTGCKNITISRNKFTSGGITTWGGNGLNNVLVTNNIFYNGGYYGIDVKYGNNWMIKNNIFVFAGSSNTIINSNQSSVTVDHNLFIGSGTPYALGTVSNILFSNNIFWGIAPANNSSGTNVNGCYFNHNLSYSTPRDTMPYGTNSGDSNLVNNDPKFVSAPTKIFSYSYDYHLMAASPGHNTATDGTDIGIYGGPYRFPDLTGYPNVPQVTLINIPGTPPTIPAGGSFNVQIKARKHN